MNRRKYFYSLLIMDLLGVGISIAADETVLSPTLKLVIQKVTFTPPTSPTTVAVTFQVTDANGQGLDRLGVITPGTISTSFVLGRIRPGDTQYTSYISNSVTATASLPACATCTTGATATQAAGDSGGTYADLGNGVYTYTFGKQLPATVDMNSTTTLAMYASRNLSAFGYPSFSASGSSSSGTVATVANAIYSFVPSGAAVTQVRDVVTTAACNQCHDPLALHGGTRQDVRLCIMCHNPGTADPYTGNTVDAKVFFHKLHMGANLPSVTGKPLNINGISGSGTSTTATGATQAPIAAGVGGVFAKPAGKPYQIIGYQNSVNDFSNVVWPQDVRNCTTCHKGGTQSDNWKNNPSRAACGSCHDDVNFATGANHGPNGLGGVQVDDTQCTVCHKADTGLEFDLSVAGAHTMPWKSKQLPGLNIAITGVSGTNPGNNPTVWFKVSDNKGNPVDATKLTALAFVLAGPTTDYTFPTGAPGTENALPYVTATSGGFFYRFAAAIPANATGTSYAVGAQAYMQATIPGPVVGQNLTVRNIAFNPVFYFGVGGATAVPRRTVVDVKNCNVCHETLGLHGGARQNTQFCVLCHNPSAGDTQTPAQTVNFRTHIHRIHSGVNLENLWTINGSNNFNGVGYPGDRRDCAKCHVNNSNQLPVPAGLANANTGRLFYTPMQPTAQACLGCHDGVDAAAHAYLQTSPFGESCPVCHEEGADFAVSKVHAR